MNGAARAYSKVDCGGLDIPLFPHIVNHGLDSYIRVRDRVDALQGTGVEWDKVALLVNEPTYIAFLAGAGGCGIEHVVSTLNQFAADEVFRGEMEKPLADLAMTDAPGDLRFHAITLYCLARIAQPQLIIETGVAHGKSSAFLLLALEHNGHGEMISIDLPPDGNLADGSKTAMYERPVGWLVPERLRSRWAFHPGDSLAVLPKVLAEAGEQGLAPDFFLHDSLHTFDHTMAELELVCAAASGEAFSVCVDNIDMGSGVAFDEFLERRGGVGFAFRDFAAARLTAR